MQGLHENDEFSQNQKGNRVHMRLRKLIRSLSYMLRGKRKEYKFEHERPTGYEVKMYLAKRRLEREKKDADV